MADSSKYTITVRTEAELDALKRYQAELKRVGLHAELAGGKKGVGGLTESLKDASAATDPAVQLQTALALILRGDVSNGAALATSAIKGLSGALRANPIGLLVTALTLAAGALTIFKQKSDEATKATAALKKEADAAADKLAEISGQANEPLGRLTKTTADLAEQMKVVADQSERALQTFIEMQDARAAAEDAQLGLDLAQIDADTAKAPGQKTFARAAARSASAARRQQIEQETIAGQITTVEGTGRNATRERELAIEQRDNAKAAIEAQQLELQRTRSRKVVASVQGRDQDALGFQGDEEELAKQIEAAKAEYTKRLEAVQKASKNEEEIAVQTAAEVESLRRRSIESTRIFDIRAKQAKVEATAQVIAESDALRRGNQQGSQGEASAEAIAARQRFEQLSPAQKAGALARDAVAGRTGEGGVTGQLAQAINQAGQALGDGDQGGEMERLIKLLEQFAEFAAQTSDQKKRVETRLQQIEQQMRNTRS